MTAADYEPDALAFTRLNCLLNVGYEPASILLDWRTPDLDETFSCILAADLAYEQRSFQPLLTCFDQLLRPGGCILLGEPNRRIARPFFTTLRKSGWQLDALHAANAVTCYRITRA